MKMILGLTNSEDGKGECKFFWEGLNEVDMDLNKARARGFFGREHDEKI